MNDEFGNYCFVFDIHVCNVIFYRHAKIKQPKACYINQFMNLIHLSLNNYLKLIHFFIIKFIKFLYKFV